MLINVDVLNCNVVMQRGNAKVWLNILQRVFVSSNYFCTFFISKFALKTCLWLLFCLLLLHYFKFSSTNVVACACFRRCVSKCDVNLYLLIDLLV